MIDGTKERASRRFGFAAVRRECIIQLAATQCVRESAATPKDEVMPSNKSIDLARRAQAIYEARLRQQLEPTNPDDFVAIEPESGDYFLGKTLSEAIQAARAAYPQRLPFALRVGHRSTVELGVMCP
jgi:hypothetical protein